MPCIMYQGPGDPAPKGPAWNDTPQSHNLLLMMIQTNLKRSMQTHTYQIKCHMSRSSGTCITASRAIASNTGPSPETCVFNNIFSK